MQTSLFSVSIKSLWRTTIQHNNFKIYWRLSLFKIHIQLISFNVLLFITRVLLILLKTTSNDLWPTTNIYVSVWQTSNSNELITNWNIQDTFGFVCLLDSFYQCDWCVLFAKACQMLVSHDDWIQLFNGL